MTPKNRAAPGQRRTGGEQIERLAGGRIDFESTGEVKRIDWSAVHRCAEMECRGHRSRWCPWECIEVDR